MPDTSAADDTSTETAQGAAVGASPGDGAAEVVTPDGVSDEVEAAVTEPAKVMRIGSMIKLLLEEVRATSLDEASRERLAEVFERSVTELCAALSPELQEELRSLTLPFDQDEVPSEPEIRVAKAQLVGWLEGLFHGIQASLMAQQLAARQQLQGMRQLPGTVPGQQAPEPAGVERPGTYL